jgi:hypothetical protein
MTTGYRVSKAQTKRSGRQRRNFAQEQRAKLKDRNFIAKQSFLKKLQNAKD